MRRGIVVAALVFAAACSSRAVGPGHLRPWPVEVSEVETSVDCGAGRVRECSRSWVLEPLTDVDSAVSAVEAHIERRDLAPLPGVDPCFEASCALVEVVDGLVVVRMSYAVS